MAQSGVPQLKRVGNDAVKLQSTSPTLRIHGPKVKRPTYACYATLRSVPECAAVVDLSFIASKLRFPVQTTPPPSTGYLIQSWLTANASPILCSEPCAFNNSSPAAQHAHLGNQLSSPRGLLVPASPCLASSSSHCSGCSPSCLAPPAVAPGASQPDRQTADPRWHCLETRLSGFETLSTSTLCFFNVSADRGSRRCLLA